MVEFVLLVLGLIVLYYLIIYIIAPLGGILLLVTLVASLGYAFYTSIRSFSGSLMDHLDPYTTYLDKSKSPAAAAGIRRNYFFGPGYHQIAITISDAFLAQKGHLETLKSWRDKHTGHPWYRDMWIWIFYIASGFSTYVLGFAWMGVFSVLLATVLLLGMSGFYVFFMSLWSVDRLTLLLRSIQSRCANCKRISIVPAFLCPECGLAHYNLTPGPYGVFERKCLCGQRMASTYFTGRSRYEATCPTCEYTLAASDARQFGIQLVGGVSAGKTTYLSAFWHVYRERLKTAQGVSVEVEPEDAFEELESWYQYGDSAATLETNAVMYSLIHRWAGRTPLQMTLYDIAGEAFAALENTTQQQQFRYCEGIIFAIDPTASPTVTAETVSSFIQEFAGQKGAHFTKLSEVPVAVMITKADLFKRDIGLPKTRAVFASRPQQYADAEGHVSLGRVRDGMCQAFLENHDFGNVLNLIDGAFNKIRYYAVSAIGHPVEAGQTYEPWGVLAPVRGILAQYGAEYQEVLSLLGSE